MNDVNGNSKRSSILEKVSFVAYWRLIIWNIFNDFLTKKEKLFCGITYDRKRGFGNHFIVMDIHSWNNLVIHKQVSLA